MSKRDPFPSPKPETDATLSGFRPPQTEEPWSHLHSCATVASSQRGAAQGHGNSGDSLDFQLQAIYDHSKDFFWTKSQMLYQRESVSEGPRKQDKEKREEGEGIRMWVDPQRCSVYNIK